MFCVIWTFNSARPEDTFTSERDRASTSLASMINFLNDITGGNLLLWKVVLTSIVFALAGLQVVMAARFWGRPLFAGLSPGTAVRWMHQAGADWNRYAADIARSRDHQP